MSGFTIKSKASTSYPWIAYWARLVKKIITTLLSISLSLCESFFDFGNVKTKTQFGNEINCYSKEKTIIELIRKRDNYPSEIFIKAIKLFLKRNDKNLPLLFECAKMRNIEKKTFEIMELLGYGN